MRSKPLYVAIFWHMHQPPYHLKTQRLSILPWVRLHAVKDYYDMPAYVEEFPGFKCTINMVPSLVEQILMYENNETSDYFLTLSERDANELTLEEKAFILLNFFSINVEKNIKPYPRYYSLYQKRGHITNLDEARKAAYAFTEDEIRDIQVWFNLVWCGRTLKKQRKIRNLLEKGGAFTEEEKSILLSSHKEIICKVIPLLKKLQESGNIEISTSPYNHPICPLLCDTRTAKTSDPTTILPQRIFHHPEDAIEQVRSAIEYHEKIFGKKPAGIWPPEAGVSESTISIFAELGIRWFITDEDIFRLSVKLSVGEKSESILARPENFYRPHKFYKKGKEIIGFFRDKRISNRISFDYYALKGEEAVKDLIGTLKNIRERLPEDEHDYVVTIAMDGENAWEYFDDNGEVFLKNLCSSLASDPELVPITFSEFIDNKSPKIDYLDRIYPGSWIGTNFKTWIGNEEKNKAWEILAKVRDDLERFKGHEKWAETYECLLKAEASDWFWWYGSGNITGFAREFDYLFRNHLKEAYIQLGLEPPSFLEETIIKAFFAIPPARKPTRLFEPVLDGESAAFFEWSPAGYYEAQKFALQNFGFEYPLVNKVYFGFSKDKLFLRVEFQEEKAVKVINEENTFILEFARPKKIRLEFKKKNGKILCETSFFNGENWQNQSFEFTYAVKDVVEISIPFSVFDVKGGESIYYFVQIAKGSTVIERFPPVGFMEMIVPQETFEEDFWYV